MCVDPLAAQQMLDRMFQVNVLPEARNESELESSFSEREDIEQKARFDNNSKLGTKIGYELVHQRQNLMTQLSQKAMSIPEIHRALNRVSRLVITQSYLSFLTSIIWKLHYYNLQNSSRN